MKKFSLVLVIGMIVTGVTMTSCSSKQAVMDEPAINASAETTPAVETANLGGASSGQGR